MNKQSILFGINNCQTIINQTVLQSLPDILNALEEELTQKSKSFDSVEVHKAYSEVLTSRNIWINTNHSDLFQISSYILYPFKTSPSETTLQNKDFLESLIDTLCLLDLANFQCDMTPNFLNLRLDGVTTFGLYYPPIRLDLKESFIRLIHELKVKNAELPLSFTFIILRCSGQDISLDSEKIKNIVPDIMLDSSYIKPLQLGSPRCVTLTTYFIKDCQNLESLSERIKGLLSND